MAEALSDDMPQVYVQVAIMLLLFLLHLLQYSLFQSFTKVSEATCCRCSVHVASH